VILKQATDLKQRHILPPFATNRRKTRECFEICIKL